MPTPTFPDKYNWHGCAAVQFDSDKLSGRATVGNTRMDADGVLENFLDGLSAEEIAESYSVELGAVRQILAFASSRGLKATA